MKPSLFVVWFFATASDAIAAALAALYLHRMKTRFTRFLALCLLGVAFEALVAAASLLIFWPDELTVAPAFAITRAAGRTIKSACVWTLVLYLFNFCERIQQKVDEG